MCTGYWLLPPPLMAFPIFNVGSPLEVDSRHLPPLEQNYEVPFPLPLLTHTIPLEGLNIPLTSLVFQDPNIFSTLSKGEAHSPATSGESGMWRT